ncbi:hypothetical protein ACFV5J_23360 [Streptomyces zaomyceticus]|uniref:hypothetical protein n=1 Tax=Streptomyces zaomyceticus TaxID=68286 RepID=UPI00364D32F5
MTHHNDEASGGQPKETSVTHKRHRGRLLAAVAIGAGGAGLSAGIAFGGVDPAVGAGVATTLGVTVSAVVMVFRRVSA